jgi:hypothetical protein
MIDWSRLWRVEEWWSYRNNVLIILAAILMLLLGDPQKTPNDEVSNGDITASQGILNE